MPKYSTGGRRGEREETACELCGEPADTLTDATVAGAELVVCTSCASHNDTPQTERDSETQPPTEPPASASDDVDHEGDTHPQTSRQDRAAHGTSSLWDSDTTHWEEGGVNYEADRLPYLVSDYDDRVRRAREAAGLTRDEVAAKLTITQREVFVVEQGNAVTAGIGGSTITALEDYLDVTLTD